MSDIVLLSNLLAKKFIARTDVKAVQYSNGKWSPHQEFNSETGKHDGSRIPWRREDLEAHLTAKKTFGHYLLNTEGRCKLFAFDIDLEKQGWLPTLPLGAKDGTTDAFSPWAESFQEVKDLRAAWLDRSHPGRYWMKYQFKMLAHMLLRGIEENLEIPALAAYSGGKGVHVYGFTGLISADDAREGAQIVLDAIGEFKPLRGEHFFRHANEDRLEGYPNLTIEVFPKQRSLDGKDLGNLMRLPLGRNLKSTDPTFFIDMRTPMGVMKPRDAKEALTARSPWE